MNLFFLKQAATWTLESPKVCNTFGCQTLPSKLKGPVKPYIYVAGSTKKIGWTYVVCVCGKLMTGTQARKCSSGKCCPQILGIKGRCRKPHLYVWALGNLHFTCIKLIESIWKCFRLHKSQTNCYCSSNVLATVCAPKELLPPTAYGPLTRLASISFIKIK